MLIVDERPATRCAVRPGSRAIDSAMLESGSLPMSSAEIDSTIDVASRLVSIEVSMLRRMPVTVTAARSDVVFADSACAFFSAARLALASSLVPDLSVVSAAVCACAAVAISTVADARATLSRLRLSFNISPLHSQEFVRFQWFVRRDGRLPGRLTLPRVAARFARHRTPG
jgi:hypothetical protein